MARGRKKGSKDKVKRNRRTKLQMQESTVEAVKAADEVPYEENVPVADEVVDNDVETLVEEDGYNENVEEDEEPNDEIEA